MACLQVLVRWMVRQWLWSRWCREWSRWCREVVGSGGTRKNGLSPAFSVVSNGLISF